jgi:hypothetical protein
MAAKKKTKKQHPKLKKTAAKKGRPIRKTVRKKAQKKKLTKKKPALKKTVVKTKALGKKKAAAKTPRDLVRRAPRESQKIDAESFALQGRRSRSAGQSGDLQGLSNVEAADSESVEELIEEGNAFEADVVAGVERAGNDRMKEVRTHEVPEDDVPGEYLDKE